MNPLSQADFSEVKSFWKDDWMLCLVLQGSAMLQLTFDPRDSGCIDEWLKAKILLPKGVGLPSFRCCILKNVPVEYIGRSITQVQV